MRARAPASTANLGPGFDVLAVALDRYVQVEVEPAPSLHLRSEGEGAGLADDASHLAARVAIGVIGHDRLAVTVRRRSRSRRPGIVRRTGRCRRRGGGRDDPLGVAAASDGHPENAAASVFGDWSWRPRWTGVPAPPTPALP